MEIFLDKYRPKKGEEQIAKVRKLDASMMPPCKRVMWNKFRRTQLIARRWLSTADPHPPDDNPEDFGWKLQDGNYKINWFDGDTLPNIMEVVLSEDLDEAEEGMH